MWTELPVHLRGLEELVPEPHNTVLTNSSPGAEGAGMEGGTEDEGSAWMQVAAMPAAAS